MDFIDRQGKVFRHCANYDGRRDIECCRPSEIWTMITLSHGDRFTMHGRGSNAPCRATVFTIAGYAAGWLDKGAVAIRGGALCEFPAITQARRVIAKATGNA